MNDLYIFLGTIPSAIGLLNGLGSLYMQVNSLNGKYVIVLLWLFQCFCL